MFIERKVCSGTLRALLEESKSTNKHKRRYLTEFCWDSEAGILALSMVLKILLADVCLHI